MTEEIPAEAATDPVIEVTTHSSPAPTPAAELLAQYKWGQTTLDLLDANTLTRMASVQREITQKHFEDLKNAEQEIASIQAFKAMNHLEQFKAMGMSSHTPKNEALLTQKLAASDEQIASLNSQIEVSKQLFETENEILTAITEALVEKTSSN